MTVLYLTEDEVRELVDMPTAIDAVRSAFRMLAEGMADNVPRKRAHAPGIVLHQMSAAAGELGCVGHKTYTTTRSGARFDVVLYDAETGRTTAILEADHLGRLRTGAASGVATDLMARPNARTVGLFGTGRQARTQLLAVCAVRGIERVEVHGRDAERRQRFAEEMTATCGVDVVPLASAEDVVREKDVIVTATSAKRPLFDGRDLAPGAHLNVIGSNWLTKAEIDVETVRRADHIVCDDVDACRTEAGDFVEAIERGITNWSRMQNLADVVAGRVPGRLATGEITLFKSVGLAIEDVVLAHEVVRRARATGVGREVTLRGSDE